MKVAASPRSRTQVAAVLAFVISHTTFLAAQDDEMGRCPKVRGEQVSHWWFSGIGYLTANDKDFSLALEMMIRESLMPLSLWIASH